MALAAGVLAVVLGGLSLWLIKWYFHEQRRRGSLLPRIPEVPGRLPVIGNALQLWEKKPHCTFLKWAKTYGPIFSVRVGSKSFVVLNNESVAMEAMVTRFSSISRKAKMSKALHNAAFNQCMVAMCDYSDFQTTFKRHMIKNVVGPNAQKRHRVHRDTLIANLVEGFRTHVKNNGLQPVNFRDIFSSELFGLAMKQALGRDVEYITVDELGRLSKPEIHKILLKDPVEIALEYFDLRDFFPYLKWIPMTNFDRRIEKMYSRRLVVMKALIEEQSKRVASGKEMNCYLKYLLTEEKTLTEKELASLLWEVVMETSDTTLTTAEWAMFELAKNQKLQECLYEEIQSVCGSNKITEENLRQLPLLEAIFYETVRTHAPPAMMPLRYADEDTELGGYCVPAGSEIIINLHGCNMDENQWEKPEVWNPERFLKNKKYAPDDSYKTMSFGAGKRLCPGILQAKVIFCTTIGRLVQEFEWRLIDGEEENVDIVEITNMKLHPLHAVIRPRN